MQARNAQQGNLRPNAHSDESPADRPAARWHIARARAFASVRGSMGARSTKKTAQADSQQPMPDEGESSGYRPGMALRVAIGFAAVAVTVIVANLSLSKAPARREEKVRELLVQHEPLVRATEIARCRGLDCMSGSIIDQSRKQRDLAAAGQDSPAQRMTDAADSVRRAAGHFPKLDGPAPRIHRRARRLFGRWAKSCSPQHCARRTRMRDYWSRLRSIGSQPECAASQRGALRRRGVREREADGSHAHRSARFVSRVSAAASMSSPRSVQG